ncbi:MAG: hypothetical protein VX336_00975 [Actinomycetota bacterium]|nr:hypothetical protein [Actinomycetota bacterium]
MTAFVDFPRRFVDISPIRHHLNRRRRLVAALLAGDAASLVTVMRRHLLPQP